MIKPSIVDSFPELKDTEIAKCAIPKNLRQATATKNKSKLEHWINYKECLHRKLQHVDEMISQIRVSAPMVVFENEDLNRAQAFLDA